MRRPLVVALDIVETTFALEPLAARFAGAGLPQGALRLFFAQMLREAGMRVIALTNGSAPNTGKLLASSGLDAYVERVISIDEVRRWKPNREVYLHAARACGVEPGRVALIAAHAWDVHGAKQARLIGAWLTRQDKRYHPAISPPDISVQTMTEAAAALAALPA